MVIISMTQPDFLSKDSSHSRKTVPDANKLLNLQIIYSFQTKGYLKKEYPSTVSIWATHTFLFWKREMDIDMV